MKLRSYKFRLYPSKLQQRRIFAQFEGSCELYSVLLQKCKDAYKKEGISPNLKLSYARLLGGSKLPIQSLNKFILKFSKIVLTGSAKPTKLL
jgi:transposase